MATEINNIRIELLAIRCKRNELAAWRELISLFSPRLLYYLRRLLITEPEAIDALQETWICASGGLPKLSDPSRMACWLYKIARNIAVNRIRSIKREQEAIEQIEHLLAYETHEETFSATNAERVHQALAELPLLHREALTLFFMEGFNIKEMAEILKLAEGTVKSRLYYAKAALKQAMNSMEDSKNGQ